MDGSDGEVMAEVGVSFSVVCVIVAKQECLTARVRRAATGEDLTQMNWMNKLIGMDGWDAWMMMAGVEEGRSAAGQEVSELPGKTRGRRAEVIVFCGVGAG